jgi:hypothetical protein
MDGATVLGMEVVMRNQWLFSAWQRLFVAGALLMTLLLGVSAKANALGASTLISLTNTQRAAAGLGPLAYNGQLSSSANAKAQDMLAKGYWGHSGPDGSSAWTFVSRAGYAYTAVGENLARDYGSDSAVISAWMASPTHRANMLNGAFQHIGIAVVSGTLAGAPTTLVVAHFGATSAAPAPAPTPAPAPKPAPRPSAPAPKPVAQTATAPVTQQPAAQPAALPAETSKAEVQTPKKDDPVKRLLDGLIEMIEPENPELLTNV